VVSAALARVVSLFEAGMASGAVTSLLNASAPAVWEPYRWYIVAAIVLLVLQGAMIAAMVVQRSRRRDAEARDAAILRALPDMMFLQTRDGVYVDYHTPDDALLLIPPDAFMGRNMRDVLPANVAAHFEEEFRRLVPGQGPLVVEYALPAPEGERQYEAHIVACAGDRILSVVRDITERKRSETALGDSQVRYALATAAGGVGVWDWNIETNEIYTDPLLKVTLGYEDHEIGHRMEDWVRLIHPDDRAIAQERAADHTAGKAAAYEVELRMLHRDGTIRWFLARGSIVRRAGMPVRVVGTSTDITERKKSEQALHEAQTELMRVSRLTSLGEFAASIAHEVSQPLTAIVMNAKTCLRWLAAPSPDVNEIRAALWDVVDAGKRADEVIRRNRELFRHHTVSKAQLDVNQVIRETGVLAATRLHSSEVVLATKLAPSLPRIFADRVELQQVLLNLIMNGIDAMEGVDPGSRRIEIDSSLLNGGVVRVSVRDNGVGLAGVDMTRLFAPSYTTKANGTGVGLSISRSIVEAHGGHLWAEQNPDRGATFAFTLPVHSAAATH
jgi:PAS domain S-box-containing protein